MLFHNINASLDRINDTLNLVMIMVDISYLFVDITQLHVAFVHLVVVYHLVYFLDPLVIHKHAVVTLSYHFLPSDEFVILRFHTISHRLDY